MTHKPDMASSFILVACSRLASILATRRASSRPSTGSAAQQARTPAASISEASNGPMVTGTKPPAVGREQPPAAQQLTI
jgi:hypothetical protein